MRRAAVIAILFLAPAVPAAHGEPPLPLVDGVEWAPLRDHCRRLMEELELLKAPLPADATRALTALLRDEPSDPDAAAAAVQKLLDPSCLLAVDINPESRVKALRGPAQVDLERDQMRIALVKVQNEAGSTAALRVSGAGLCEPGQAGDGRWLEATPAFPGKLSGRRLEYVLIRLTARESGKREATFRFDVGQGTQDLGFRAETPILFAVRGR